MCFVGAPSRDREGNQGIRRKKTVDSESLIMSMCTVVRDYLKKGNKFKFVLYLVLSHRAWSGFQDRCDAEKHGDVAARLQRLCPRTYRRLSYTSPHMQDRCCDKFYTFLHIFGKCVVVSLFSWYDCSWKIGRRWEVGLVGTDSPEVTTGREELQHEETKSLSIRSGTKVCAVCNYVGESFWFGIEHRERRETSEGTHRHSVSGRSLVCIYTPLSMPCHLAVW